MLISVKQIYSLITGIFPIYAFFLRCHMQTKMEHGMIWKKQMFKYSEFDLKSNIVIYFVFMLCFF